MCHRVGVIRHHPHFHPTMNVLLGFLCGPKVCQSLLTQLSLPVLYHNDILDTFFAILALHRTIGRCKPDSRSSCGIRCTQLEVFALVFFYRYSTKMNPLILTEKTH